MKINYFENLEQANQQPVLGTGWALRSESLCHWILFCSLIIIVILIITIQLIPMPSFRPLIGSMSFLPIHLFFWVLSIVCSVSHRVTVAGLLYHIQQNKSPQEVKQL